MKVVGITSQQEVFVASRRKNFRINEFLVIEDPIQQDLIGEVVEAHTYNRYIPMDTSSDFVDRSVLESLKALGYNIEDETIYLCVLRLLEEALYPIETGSNIREPIFSEVEDLMISCPIEEGLSLGIIKNTDTMYRTMDEKYKGLMKIFESNKIKEQEDIPYIFDLKNMHHYPHIGVFGGSGSGKSFGLRVLLEEVMQHDFPTLVLDPHFEMDFSQSAAYLDLAIDYNSKFIALQVGKDVGVRFEDINQQDLKNLLNAASNLTDSMSNVVDIIFKNGDSLHSFKNRLSHLIDGLEEGSEEKIRERIYKAESSQEEKSWKKKLEVFEAYGKTCPYASVKGIMWRLTRLENDGVFSKDIRPIEEAIRNGKLVVVQGNTRLLQVFSTYLLNKLYHKRRNYKDALYIGNTEEYFPPFMIVTDEAHNFAPKGYDSPSKSILKEISQEGRKYGVFLILATQRPTLLDETITAQLNSKFIFRTVRASDIETIKEETDLTFEETKRLPYLKTGDVFISSAILGRTVYSRIRAAHTESPHRENPFDELKKFKNKDRDEFFIRIKKHLPFMESSKLGVLKDLEAEGYSITGQELDIKLDSLAEAGLIEKEDTKIFGFQYKLGGE